MVRFELLVVLTLVYAILSEKKTLRRDERKVVLIIMEDVGYETVAAKGQQT